MCLCALLQRTHLIIKLCLISIQLAQLLFLVLDPGLQRRDLLIALLSFLRHHRVERLFELIVLLHRLLQLLLQLAGSLLLFAGPIERLLGLAELLGLRGR